MKKSINHIWSHFEWRLCEIKGAAIKAVSDFLEKNDSKWRATPYYDDFQEDGSVECSDFPQIYAWGETNSGLYYVVFTFALERVREYIDGKPVYEQMLCAFNVDDHGDSITVSLWESDPRVIEKLGILDGSERKCFFGTATIQG